MMKMLGRMVRRKRDASVIIDVFVAHSTYNKFRAYLAKNSLDESKALVNVLERGIANYWLQQFKELKQDYQFVEKSFKEYKKDNDVLSALERQNEQLQKIWEKRSARENSNPSTKT